MVVETVLTCTLCVFLSSASSPELATIRPIELVAGSGETKAPPVEWTNLGRSSLRFLGLMHGFRLLTEPGTRQGGFTLGRGYYNSVTNLHGWADGDPFYVNYVGHPMMGAVANRLFLLNDPKYYAVAFGKSREYWKSRLRGAAFAWGFSAQFEIGPLSEASVGKIQKDFPQQGFVDHVVTPSIGLSWVIAEDAIDEYVVKRIERRTHNRWARIFARAGLNPARTAANVMDGKAPWYRENRSGVLTYEPIRAVPSYSANEPPKIPGVAPVEFTIASSYRGFTGGGSCVGGGGEGALRISAEWQMVLDVNGCKMVGMQTDYSGDALIYQIGPRWTASTLGRWMPYAHVLLGGMKITHEQMYPEKKRLVEGLIVDTASGINLHSEYTRQEEASGFALSAGTGINYKLNEALAVKVASIEYMHTKGIGTLGGLNYNNGLQVTAGMVVRFGTW